MHIQKGDKCISVYLENNGLGPAVLKKIEVYFQGKKIEWIQSNSNAGDKLFHQGKYLHDGEEIITPSNMPPNNLIEALVDLIRLNSNSSIITKNVGGFREGYCLKEKSRIKLFDLSSNNGSISDLTNFMGVYFLETDSYTCVHYHSVDNKKMKVYRSDATPFIL